MERCPTCQARLREEPVCPRCRTDLGQALAAERQAVDRLHMAIARLAAGHVAAARQELDQSMQLKRQPLAVVLRTFLDQRDSPNRSDLWLRAVPGVLEKTAETTQWKTEEIGCPIDEDSILPGEKTVQAQTEPVGSGDGPSE